MVKKLYSWIGSEEKFNEFTPLLDHAHSYVLSLWKVYCTYVINSIKNIRK